MSNTIIEVQHRFKKTKANKPMRAKFNLLVLQQMLPVWHENKEYQNGGWAPIRNESLMDFIPEEAKDEVEDTSMTGEELTDENSEQSEGNEDLGEKELTPISPKSESDKLESNTSDTTHKAPTMKSRIISGDTSMTGEELKKYILDTKLGVNEKQTKPNMIKDLKALWNV